MSVLEIITHPNSMLTTPTDKLTKADILSSNIQTLIEDMKDTCVDSEGAGLAANQVNRGLAICVIRGSKLFSVMINPEIISKKRPMHCKGESCLSVPGSSFNVKRFKKLTIRYLDAKGEEVIYTTKSKYLAQALAHEIDHLNGLTVVEKGKKVS